MQVSLGKKLPTYAAQDRFQPAILVGMIVIHLAAFTAPWFYTSYSIPLLVMGWVLTGGFGIAIGYHRLLSHKSFETHQWVKYALALLGVFAVQSGPIEWVSYHRNHHANSDQALDIHTPWAGFIWGHMGWIIFEHPIVRGEDLWCKAKDLASDPVFRFLDRHFLTLNLILGAWLFGTGFWLGGAETALSFLIWGGFLRIVLTWHIIFSVNSVCHRFGYRNFDTSDHSCNNPIVALLGFGEGWHNNHHANPSSASFTHHPYEFDVSFLMIRIMQRLGLVWKVRS